ncbi:MAG: protein kinase [Deltaproteobacteria bacterium]|nr:protein kinase [Deltaproteobacteria bacterium]
MAEVHLAATTEAGAIRWVVVKRMLPHLRGRSEYTHMFVDEARVASRLNHPNVLKVYDYGEDHGVPFMVLEYVDGVHMGALLTHLLARDQVIPIPYVVHMVAQACRGLHYAHEATDEHGTPLGIIHRDVSPQNVMMNRLGEVKLLDFGIAKTALQSSQTQTGVLKGKLGYMAPEHCSGETLDRRADVYSMGVTLHEMLTGARLFPEANPLEVVRRITQEDIPPPSRTNPGVPREIDEIVQFATARQPRARCPDARTLADRLEGWLFNRRDRPTPEILGAWLDRVAAEILPPPLPLLQGVANASQVPPVVTGTALAEPPVSVTQATRVLAPRVATPAPPAHAAAGLGAVLHSPAAGEATRFTSELNQMFADTVTLHEQPAPGTGEAPVSSRAWRRHGTNPFIRQVAVDDSARTAHFYERLFAAVGQATGIRGGQQLYVSHGPVTGQVPVPGAQPATGRWVPFIHLDALDPILLLVPQLGGRVVQATTRVATGSFAIIQDPVGGLLGLFSNHDAAAAS